MVVQGDVGRKLHVSRLWRDMRPEGESMMVVMKMSRA